MRVSIQTKCLAQPLRQALHTAGRLQAEGVQLELRDELPAAELSDTAGRQLRKLLDDLNLRVGSTAFPTRRGYANPEDLERRLEATLQAMHASSRLAARVMLITLGPLPLPGDPERSTLLEALTTLGMQGNRLGVQLALQGATAHPADLKSLLEELPEGLAGADFSPADIILSGGQPRKFAEELGRHILHVFANDAVGGSGGLGGTQVELGRGTADLPELLGALEEYDYRNWVTIERRNSRNPVDDIANAVQFLRSL
jgi:sugar phosphate isomerase/epimerase